MIFEAVDDEEGLCVDEEACKRGVEDPFGGEEARVMALGESSPKKVVGGEEEKENGSIACHAVCVVAL